MSSIFAGIRGRCFLLLLLNLLSSLLECASPQLRVETLLQLQMYRLASLKFLALGLIFSSTSWALAVTASNPQACSVKES